mgnify:CR=1 FL=1
MQEKKMRWRTILLIGNCQALIDHLRNIVKEYHFAILWRPFNERANQLFLLKNTNQGLFGSKVLFESLDAWVYENKI